MKLYSRQALREAQARTFPHLTETAAEPFASEREALLGAYRECFLRHGHLDLARASANRVAAMEVYSRFSGVLADWEHAHGVAVSTDHWCIEDATGFQWITKLAGAGHYGAIRLRDRILTSERALMDLPFTREQMDAVARSNPLAPIILARRECARPEPDFDVMLSWLDAGISDGWGMAGCLASVIRELRACVDLSVPANLHWLRQLLALSYTETVADSWRWGAKWILRQMAIGMLDQADDATRRNGMRVLLRAAAMGDAEARGRCRRLDPDPELVLSVFEQTRLGDRHAEAVGYLLHFLGKAWLAAGNRADALRLLRQSAELGSTNAQAELASVGKDNTNGTGKP
jgi:hypothetical protein